jgi:hypothetical protein
MSKIDAMLVNPNPRLVGFINYAIENIMPLLSLGEEADFWRDWASSWVTGQRSPQTCVDVARKCFLHEDLASWHTLGQISWAAKEACYNIPSGGWLVVRYIADAMIAFGIDFTDGEQLIEAPLAQPMERFSS